MRILRKVLRAVRSPKDRIDEAVECDDMTQQDAEDERRPKRKPSERTMNG